MKQSILYFVLSAASISACYAFERNPDTESDLFIRDLENLPAQLFPRTQGGGGGHTPFVSPFAGAAQDRSRRITGEKGSQESLSSVRSGSQLPKTGSSSPAAPSTPGRSSRFPLARSQSMPSLRLLSSSSSSSSSGAELARMPSKQASVAGPHRANKHTGGPTMRLFAGSYSGIKDMESESAGRVVDAHVDALMGLRSARRHASPQRGSSPESSQESSQAPSRGSSRAGSPPG